MPVRLDVPISLKVSPAGPERIVERAATYTEIELPVRVAANLGWTLTLALGANHDLGPVLLFADGEWRELASAVPRAAITSRDPANAVEVKLRIRLPAGTESTAALRLRISLVPTEVTGLSAREGAGVAVQSSCVARNVTVHGTFDFIVSTGPTVTPNPAS